MCTDEDASDLKEDVDNVNAKYDNVNAAIRQKLSDLDETLRNSSTDVSPVITIYFYYSLQKTRIVPVKLNFKELHFIAWP